MTGISDAEGAAAVETVRRLRRQEHSRTRGLYETVFPEDSQRFVDYYYERVAKENEIYVVEDEEEIRAMLHLNPYPVCLYDSEYLLHYIVAVGTHPAYRHKGMMRRLLGQALETMYDRGEPFTFLMPADEQIYRPFDFTWISRTNYQEIAPKDFRKDAGLTAYRAERADIPDLAWIGQRILKERYCVFAKRTQAYFERLLEEQEAMKGEVVLLGENRIPRGYLAYSAEDGVPEIRELAVERGYASQAFAALADWFYYDEKVKMYGFPEELELSGASQRPFMMGRIVHLERFVESVRAKEEQFLEFSLEDKLLPKNSGSFRCRLSPDGSAAERIAEREGLPRLTPSELLNRLLEEETVFFHETV